MSKRAVLAAIVVGLAAAGGPAMSMPAHTGPAAMATELSGAGVDRAFFGIRLFGSRRSGRRAWRRGRSGSYGYARRGRGGA
ncbi:hypothetical protein, partial [Enterovirga sp.]|uniref:hypothetical protein n=1 Tax=Enterovirga sp. TaxID=2026350 RepID=UPI00260C670D